MTTMKRPLLVVALLLAAGAAPAAERVLQFRSAEDPLSPADPLVCAAAPFKANLRLGGSLYSYETRGANGQVKSDEPRKIGSATACAQITNFAFPPGLQQAFFLRLRLPEGDYTASGSCTLISNDVPRRGLVLAGCSLHMTAFPAGVIGGAVVSLSTFNPFRLPGFTTGSFYTVQIYDAAGAGSGEDSNAAMEWMDNDE